MKGEKGLEDIEVEIVTEVLDLQAISARREL